MPFTSLKPGLQALRQESYQEAIDILTAVCQGDSPDPGVCLQAQMHLVEAHQSQGELGQAIALCQQLMEVPNAQVQIWAQLNLVRLQLK